MDAAGGVLDTARKNEIHDDRQENLTKIELQVDKIRKLEQQIEESEKTAALDREIQAGLESANQRLRESERRGVGGACVISTTLNVRTCRRVGVPVTYPHELKIVYQCIAIICTL